MATALERIRQRLGRTDLRIALPEAEDPRVLEAAARVRGEGLLRPVLVGRRQAVEEALAAAGIGHGELEIVDPATDDRRDRLAADLTVRFEALGRSASEASEAARGPLFYAGLLVAAEQADGVVAGAVVTTSDTLRMTLRVFGPRPGCALVSSCFLIELVDGRSLIYSDCGVVPDPSPEELAEIAVEAAASCRSLLGEEPRVALLSFSSKGSARHPKVDKVRQAVEILEQRQVDFDFDGELQADAALIAGVAASKAPGSSVAGHANVLVFPDLDAGNIAYKLTERLAGARAVGPLLQGVAHPVNDLSRGCSVDDVVDAMLITAVAASPGRIDR